MWRHRWVVLVASVLVAGVVFVGLSFEAKVYQATAELSVTAGQAANGQQAIQDVTPFLATTYANLAKTRPVLADAARRSRLHISEEIADARISVQTPSSIGFLELTATGPSSQDATALDSAISAALVDAVKSQQQQALQAQLAPIQSDLQQLAAQIAS